MDNFTFSDYASILNSINPDSINEFNNYMQHYYNGLLQNYYIPLRDGYNMFKSNPELIFNHLNSNPLFNPNNGYLGGNL